MSDLNRKLWCLVQGDPEPIIVTTSPNNRIAELKQLVYNEKNRGVFNDVNASDLVLWKLTEKEPIIPSRGLANRMRSKESDICLFAVKLQEASAKVSDFFPTQPPEDFLDIYVTLRTVLAGQKRDADDLFIDGRKRKQRRKDPALEIQHELSPSDMQVDLEHTPKKTREEMQDEIVQFVNEHREKIRQLLVNAGDVSLLIPSWVPGKGIEFGEKDFVDNISTLAIPVVNNVPSLLLHDIGEKRTHLDQEQAEHISRVFSFSNHKMLLNTPGSGKTRLILDGLCRHWGFYFVAMRDAAGIGSSDFCTAMEQLDTSLGYGMAKQKKNPEAMDHMKRKVHYRLMQLLLARFILLKLLIQEARKLPGGLHVKNHRRAWVLLQVQPLTVFGKDIFHLLTTLLRYKSIIDLETEIQAHYDDLKNILEPSINPAIRKLETHPIYCVVDESQILTSAWKGVLISDDSVPARSLIRQVFLSLTEVLEPEQMLVILSGTDLDYLSLLKVNRPFALFPYDIIRDIGGFDDRDSQARYIRHYLKVDWTKPNWTSFLLRAWGWCRGRYVSTAALILSILMGGYRSPHSTLNNYVFAFTTFLPTDGQEWIVNEPALHSSFDIRDQLLLSDTEVVTFRSAFFNQILYGSYSLEPFRERKAFITTGFARYKLEPRNIAAVIDEPLAILAGLTRLSDTTAFSFLECLRHDIGKHHDFPRKNGFEAYLAFHLRQVFETTPKLNQVFTFREDFARMEDLPWQHEEFDLVTVACSQISVVTPSCGPSSNVCLLAQTNDEVLEWISSNALQFTFCFPPESFGPHVLFFIRHKQSSQLLLVMVHARNYSTIDSGSLITGVRTVTPSWLWKSKNIHHSSPDDAPFVDTEEGHGLYSATNSALANIRHGLKARNAPYPILRVFASWPGDAGIGRTTAYQDPTTQQNKKARKKGNQQQEEHVPDLDLHPLATLHMANFNDIGKTLSRKWVLDDIEQREVIHPQHPPVEVEKMRKSERIRRLAHEGANTCG